MVLISSFVSFAICFEALVSWFCVFGAYASLQGYWISLFELRAGGLDIPCKRFCVTDSPSWVGVWHMYCQLLGLHGTPSLPRSRYLKNCVRLQAVVGSKATGQSLQGSADFVLLSLCSSLVEAFDTTCKGNRWFLIYDCQIHDVGGVLEVGG